MKKILASNYFGPVVLFFFSLISFGIFIPFLGLYSDDWIFLSIYQKFGHDGVTQYFQTNRPVWGLLYQFTLPILGKSVSLWHVFAMFAQFSCGLAFWKLLLLLWPEKKLRAMIGSILFILYPGFTLLPISITFGHIYIVYLFFLLSTIFMIKATRIGKRQSSFIFLSLLFYLANLLMMEYFFCLSFIQPILLWIFFRDNQCSLKVNFHKLVKFYWPWVLLLVAVIIWRIFIFDYQTYNYGLNSIEILKNNPLLGISTLAADYFVDLFKTGLYVWIEPIQYIFDRKNQTTVFYASIILMSLSFIASFVLLHLFSQNQSRNEPISSFNVKGIFLSFVALSLAGWPFWVTGLDVTLNGLYSRFTLPFILGSCLLIVSILELIRIRIVRLVIVSILIGLSLGKNLLVMNEFRQEHILVSSYMNQLHERIPDLKPGAFIISNSLPFSYFSYATLTSIVDWAYSPHNTGNTLDHVLVYSNDRVEDLSNPIYKYENVSFKFEGPITNSISSVTLYDYGVAPIGFNSCFTVLDQGNLPYYVDHISEQSKKFVPFSDINNIAENADPETEDFFQRFFPIKNTKKWCLDFEKLAKLQAAKDHQEIVDNYVDGSKPFYTPEILPYLDAFARNKDWTKVYIILEMMNKISPDFVCIFISDYAVKLKDPEFDKNIYEKFNQLNNCSTKSDY
jgi:hypothetical protein